MNKKYFQRFNILLSSIIDKTKHLKAGESAEINVNKVYNLEDIQKIRNSFLESYVFQIDATPANECSCPEMIFPYYVSWIKFTKK